MTFLCLSDVCLLASSKQIISDSFYKWIFKSMIIHTNIFIMQSNNTIQSIKTWYHMGPGIILCMRAANWRRHYNVKLSLIGWAHTQNELFEDTPYISLTGDKRDRECLLWVFSRKWSCCKVVRLYDKNHNKTFCANNLWCKISNVCQYDAR